MVAIVPVPDAVAVEPAAAADATQVASPCDSDLRKFALTFYGAFADSDAAHGSRLGQTSQSGAYLDYVNTVLVPGPSPPFFLQEDIPATLAQAFPSSNPFNPGFTAGGPAVQSGAPRPLSDAESSRYGVTADYAPSGDDRPGWRFSGTLSSERHTLTSRLATPLVGAGLSATGPSTAAGCFFFGLSGVCTILVRSTPASVSTLQTDSAGPGFTALTADGVRSRSERTGVAGALGYAWTIASPAGPLEVRPYASLGVDQWNYEEVETQVGVRPGGAAATVTSRRTGDGPGVRAGLGVAVSGRFSQDLPLTWRVDGEYGGQYVDLKLDGRAANGGRFDRVEAYGHVGARLGLDLPGGWSPYVSIRRRTDLFVTSSYLGSGDVRLADGSNLQLKTAGSSEVEAGVAYRF